MELICIKIKLKGLSSTELALEEKKEKRLTICHFLTYLVQTFMTVSMDALGLIG